MSEKKLSDDVVEKILKARDALVMNDCDEAYHQLYGIASVQYDKYFPWEEMEKQVNYPKVNEEQYKVRKEFDGRHVQRSGAVWVKASDRLPGFKTPVKWRLDGIERNKGKVIVVYMATGESPAFLSDYEWLDESGTAAGREEGQKLLGQVDPVDFAKWMLQYDFETKYTKSGKAWICPRIYPEEQFTTEQVYDLFNGKLLCEIREKEKQQKQK